MILASLSAVAYAAVFAYSITREPQLAPLIAPFAAFGALMLLFVLVRGTDDLLGWALGLGGLAYGGATVAHGTHVDGAAPLVGVALLLCGELAAWSLDERPHVETERAVLALRAAAVAALAVASLAISALVIALSVASFGGGLAWTVLGAAALVGLVALTLRVARTA
jgi:hypothetical protein